MRYFMFFMGMVYLGMIIAMFIFDDLKLGIMAIAGFLTLLIIKVSEK